MGSIPRVRSMQAVERSRLLEYLPSFIGNFRPVPSGPDPKRHRVLLAKERYEIYRQSKLVSGRERSRFRDTFGLQVGLTAREAESLEDFEAQLKLTGS